MREVAVKRVTIGIVAFLLAAAGLFAWGRSRQTRARETSPGAETDVADVGMTVYAAQCSFCHGRDLESRAELGRRTDEYYRAEGGSEYLVDLLLAGLEADADDDLDHPPFDDLTDSQIAALLEYLLAYGPPERTAGARPPITPAAIAGRRDADVDPTQVSEQRRILLERMAPERR